MSVAAAPPILRKRVGIKPWLIGGLLVLLLFILVFPSLMFGSPVLSFGQLSEILFANGGDKVTHLIVTELRMPRLVLGMIAGAALGLAGVLLQDSLRNPLAGPELLGVSSGASAVVAAITVFRLPFAVGLTPWLALLGGLVAGTVVILAMRRISNGARLALVGSAITALLNALVISIISLGSPNDVAVLYLFLLGSLAGRTWDHVNLIWPWLLICIPLALVCARALNLLQLGDDMAEGLGLKVLRMRFFIALLSAGLVAAVVAVCGPISYISLLAPHVSRRILGTSDARQVLPVAALMGAVLLIVADLLARLALSPVEMPVGVWTTLVGGPILLVLIRRQMRNQKR